jgi:hypothetical protein
MAEVEVHFTEYFGGETVAVSSQGRELLRAERLHTDMRTSLARVARIELPPQRIEVTFEVVSKDARAAIAIDPSELKFVVVSLKGDQLRLEAVTVSDYKREPRGYA